MRQKKLNQLTEKEKKMLSKIINSAQISVFDQDKLKKKLAKALTDLLESIDTLLYGEK